MIVVHIVLKRFVITAFLIALLLVVGKAQQTSERAQKPARVTVFDLNGEAFGEAQEEKSRLGKFLIDISQARRNSHFVVLLGSREGLLTTCQGESHILTNGRWLINFQCKLTVNSFAKRNLPKSALLKSLFQFDTVQTKQMDVTPGSDIPTVPTVVVLSNSKDASVEEWII